MPSQYSGNEALDLETLSHRVGRLEKQNRRLHMVGPIAVAVSVACLLLAAQEHNKHTIQRGTGFELVDADGNVRASLTLSNNNEPSLRMFDAKGQRNVFLGPDQVSTSLVLYDNKDQLTVSLATGIGTGNALSGLALRDITDQKIVRETTLQSADLRMTAGADSGKQRKVILNGQSFSISNEVARQTAQLTVDEQPGVVWGLRSDDGDVRFGPHSNPTHSNVLFMTAHSPAKNKSAINLEVSDDGPRLQAIDKDGNVVFTKP